MKKGVCQGCILLSLLFNLYAEAIFNETLTESEDRIPINSNLINNICYADGSLVLASTEQ